MRNEYREIILESRYKRDWYTELWMAFKFYPHCSKIGAMTHISNNLAARLSTGVLQRKWRMRGRGALSIVHRCTSKLVATYPSHFCANSELAGTGVYFNMEECLLWYPWLIVLVYFLSCLIIASHWSPFSVCPSSRQPICCFYSVWYLICFPINQISLDSFSAFSPFMSPCIFPRWTTQSLFIAYYYLLSNAGICLMWKLAESRMIEKKVLVWCMCAFVQACVCVEEWLKATNRNCSVSCCSRMALGQI